MERYHSEPSFDFKGMKEGDMVTNARGPGHTTLWSQEVKSELMH